MQTEKKLFGRLAQALFGKPEECSLEHRFFNASCLIGGAAGILATIINLSLDFQAVLTLSTLGISLLFSIFYFISLKKKYYKAFILPFIFISLLTLSYIWFINAGSRGPVLYVIFIGLLLYIVLTRGAIRTVTVIVVLITVSALFIFEYLYPEVIINYSDSSSRFYDLLLTALFSMIFIAFIASFIMKNYHDERNQVIKQRDKILEQNKEIRITQKELTLHKEHLEELVEKRTEELEEANVQLQNAKEKAEESDKLKTAFLSNMSHEIRTPMNAVIGFAQLLKHPDISKELTNKYIEIIINKGNLLLNIINDIIDISKVEANKIEIVKSACNIDEILHDLYITFSKDIIFIEKTQVDLHYAKPDTEKEIIIFTDPFRLKQILSNLIDNAIKFTHKGYVEFGYSIITVNKQKLLKFYVKDTGIGIAANKINLVFNRFRQIDESHTREFGGTGLGLSISKELVDLLKGEISVETKIGGGSTFFVTIPYKNAKIIEKPDLKEKPKISDYNWKDKKILIVEDNISGYWLLESYLLETQVEIIYTSDGQGAVDICKSNPDIDLVLMDIQLPVINGYDATRYIRKFRKDLPIIAQTAYAMKEDAAKTKKAGCDDCIIKPIIKHELLIMMSKFLG